MSQADKTTKRRERTHRAAVGSGALALAVALGASLALAGGSCSTVDTVPAQGRGGASDGATDTGPDTGSDAPVNPPPDAGSDADTWSPDGDSTWRPVDWPAPCDRIEVANQPHLAVPPLEWEPCDWQDGCLRQVVKWQSAGTMPITHGTVVSHAGGHRAGLRLGFDEYGHWRARAVVYETDGTPLVVWRGDSSAVVGSICTHSCPLVGQERVWFAATAISEIGSVSQTYIVAPYEQLATVSDVELSVGGDQGRHASDDTLTRWGMDGKHLFVYDRLAGEEDSFGPSGSWPAYKEAYPVGDSALLRCYNENQRPKLCVWNRDTHAVEPLVSPPTDVIPVGASDGQTLAWVRNPPSNQPSGAWLPGTIWTSPFATNEASVVADERCSAPDVLSPLAIAGEGFFAMTSFDRYIHIYRLSDMRHWSFAWPPPETYGNVRELLYVDATEIWYLAHRPIRQRFDALGPGAACPPP